MAELTESSFDRLALDACEALGYRGGRIAAYDVAGYTRILRREIPPSQVGYRDMPGAQTGSLAPDAHFENRAYLVRIAGFQRGNLYSPDEVGALFRKLGIAWNDGLGNGLYESLLIDRKYGLSHSLEAPAFEFTAPFFAEDWPRFEEDYRSRLQRLKARLKELEPVYGAQLLEREGELCVLHLPISPLSLVVQAYQQEPERVQAEVQRWTGQPTLPIEPVTVADRLALMKFWTQARIKQGKFTERIAGLLREELGSNITIVGNFHELPIYDFESYGNAFDYPAVATRPLLLEDALMLQHYTAYFTRLFRDLTGKPPIVSIRINLSAASSRFVPGPNFIQTWFDQAVRHGAGGFYLWPRDYPNDVSNPYDGPMMGNPEPNTHPQERWEKYLQLHSDLAAHQRFIPPDPQVAILVPMNSALLYRREWRRIYCAFSACVEAGIYAGFEGDWQAARSGIPAQVRLLIVPVLEFLSPALRAALEQFTKGGGRILYGAGELYDQDGNPVPPLGGAEMMRAELFDAFPLDAESSESLLQECASYLINKVEQSQLKTHAWVYDLTLACLPAASKTNPGEPDSEIQFDHWLYEHSSKWIYPYLKK